MTESNFFIKDPAIEKWAAMREHTHYYYKMNTAKILPTIILLGLVPAGLLYFTLKSFVSLFFFILKTFILVVLFYLRIGMRNSKMKKKLKCYFDLK